MHRLLRSLAALLLAASALPALATNGMRMSGFGAVQNGMGGVGTALTLDTSTIVTNPAGLADLERRLDLAATWFQPTVDQSATGAGPGVVISTDTQKSSRGGSPIPTLGLAMPLGSGLTAGLGVFGTAGMGVDYAANLYGSKLLTSYMQLRVAPALAYQVWDRVSVGVALNLAMARMKYDAASALGNPIHDTSSSLGYGATVGLKVALPRDVSLGVSYETRTRFQAFAFEVGAPEKDKLRFDQPAVLAGGLAWRPTSPLVLALDVEWINWSDTNGKNQPRYVGGPSAAPGNPLAFDLAWSDQVVLKVGAEWAVSPAWKVRAGYDYGKSPLDKSRAFESIAFPAIAEHHLSAGLGWSMSQALALNLAATWSPRASQSGANPSQGISAYSTSMSQVAFDVGMGWRF